MKPLSALPADQAIGLRGVVFDLDDTLLDAGFLTESAYSALFRLRETGLRLVACTGRPAGWGEILQRQWPVDAIVTENGAVAFARHAPRPRQATTAELAQQRARRAELLRLAERLVAQFPAAALAGDNDARRTDVTIDIGEHRRVPAQDVSAMRAIARAEGARTTQSSVHLHLTFDASDKACGTVRLLVEQFGEDPTETCVRYAFVGDSGNDAAPFAAFRITFGVSNVVAHLSRLTLAPRYLAAAPMGRGFAEIAARIVMLRTQT